MKDKINNFNYKNNLNAVLVFVVAFCLLVSDNAPQTVKAQNISSAILEPASHVLDKTKTLTEKFPQSKDREPTKTIWVTVTAYSSTIGQTDSTPCHTANGFDLCSFYKTYGDFNTVASNGLRFNTEVRIPELFGDKVFVVRDRMNSRHNYGKIDVWLPTREAAKKFGVKHVKMEVYN